MKSMMTSVQFPLKFVVLAITSMAFAMGYRPIRPGVTSMLVERR
jgi:hypothetical protein